MYSDSNGRTSARGSFDNALRRTCILPRGSCGCSRQRLLLCHCSDDFECLMGGRRRAFLPCRLIAQMLAGKNDRTLWLHQFDIDRSTVGVAAKVGVAPQRADAFGIRSETPGDADALRQEVRAPWVKGLDRFAADAQPLVVRQRGKGIGRVLMSPPSAIGADDHALCASNASRRIHHVLIETVGPAEPAENVVVFPESRRLERQLDAVEIWRSARDRCLLCG